MAERKKIVLVRDDTRVDECEGCGRTDNPYRGQEEGRSDTFKVKFCPRCLRKGSPAEKQFLTDQHLNPNCVEVEYASL